MASELDSRNSDKGEEEEEEDSRIGVCSVIAVGDSALAVAGKRESFPIIETVVPMRIAALV